jgi:hypothetical protein
LVASLVGIFLLSVIQGLLGLEAVQTDTYEDDIVAKVREHTKPEDKLLIAEGGWGGNILFLSNRQGLSIWTTAMLDEGNNLQRLKEYGYTKVVLISESPLTAALQVVNPGNADYQRRTYKQALSGNHHSWPTVYQDKDMLIKDIP